MARNTVDFCIICGCLPCECIPKPTRKSPARKPTRTVTVPSLVDPSPPRPEPPKRGRPNLSVIRSVKSDDELEFGRAITVLAAADLLHYEHLIQFREVINLPGHKIDAMIWRQRAKG